MTGVVALTTSPVPDFDCAVKSSTGEVDKFNDLPSSYYSTVVRESNGFRKWMEERSNAVTSVMIGSYVVRTFDHPISFQELKAVVKNLGGLKKFLATKSGVMLTKRSFPLSGLIEIYEYDRAMSPSDFAGEAAEFSTTTEGREQHGYENAPIIDDHELMYTRIMGVICARTSMAIYNADANILADALEKHPFIDDIRMIEGEDGRTFIVWNDDAQEWSFDDRKDTLTRDKLRRALDDVRTAIRYWFEDQHRKELEKIESRFDKKVGDLNQMIADAKDDDSKKKAKKDLAKVEDDWKEAVEDAKKDIANQHKAATGNIKNFIDGNCRVLLDAASRYFQTTTPDQINRNRRYIKTPIGCLDILEKRYVDDKALVKSLLMVGCTRVDYVETAECPVWWHTIEMTSHHQDDRQAHITMMADIMGAMVIGTNGAKYSVWVVCSTNTGKSSLFEPPREALGTFACTAPNSLFSEKQTESNVAMAGLRWKRAALIAEFAVEKYGFNEHAFKGLTGGDQMMTRILFIGYAPMTFYGLLVVMANHMPQFEHASSEIRNRIKQVNLTVDLTMQPDHVEGAAKIIKETELEGVFKVMIDSASRLLRENAEMPRFIAEVESETDDLFTVQTVYAGYITECLVKRADSKIPFPMPGENGNPLTLSFKHYADKYYAAKNWRTSSASGKDGEKDGTYFVPGPLKLREMLQKAGLPTKRGKLTVGPSGKRVDYVYVPDYEIRPEAIPTTADQNYDGTKYDPDESDREKIMKTVQELVNYTWRNMTPVLITDSMIKSLARTVEMNPMRLATRELEPHEVRKLEAQISSLIEAKKARMDDKR